MAGDYSKFSFTPRKGFSGILQQQGRVALDSDWNEGQAITERRTRTDSLDTFGRCVVPDSTPDAFLITPTGPGTFTLGIGRAYVDGYQVECHGGPPLAFDATLAEMGGTTALDYATQQPFLPPPLPEGLTGAPGTTDLVYLDVWQREVTFLEDTDLLEVALGGPDTTTRTQTVWQVRVLEDVGDLDCADPLAAYDAATRPAAARLTTSAVAPPAPDDPCIIPPTGGYRGLENRLYRVEVHTPGALGVARFKWSREAGSICFGVESLAATRDSVILHSLGRDQHSLSLQPGEWIEIIDDHRELAGLGGHMAKVGTIDPATREVAFLPAVPGAIALDPTDEARHTRVRRWDQKPVPDGDGLLAVAAGPIELESGVRVAFSLDPATPGGTFRTGDYWLFWARTAIADVEHLDQAPPRGIHHHYCRLGLVTWGDDVATTEVEDCREHWPPDGGCCTVTVRPGESIQAAIDSLPLAGGCVCLKTGLHVVREPVRIARGSIVLEAESPGTIVQSSGSGPVLMIGNPAGFRIEGIDVLGIDFVAGSTDIGGEGVVAIAAAARVRLSHCGMRANERMNFIGVHAVATDWLSVLSCRFSSLAGGILVRERCEGFAADANDIDLGGPDDATAVTGIAYVESAFPCRITRNAVSGALSGILLNDQPFADARSLADASLVTDNFVVCPQLPKGSAGARPAAIDVAADGCRISGNRIRYGDRFYVGIRVSGSFCEVTGNLVRSSMRELDILGPIAIQIGGAGEESPAPVFAGIVAQNSLAGPQHGILCTDAANLVIEGNLIESPAARVGLGFAILGTRVAASLVSGNRIGGALAGVLLNSGRQNRISSNDCRAGLTGITLFQETGPQISGNRLDELDFWGVFTVVTLARLDIVENRLVRCAVAMPNIAFALGCFGVGGEAHISANEIMDTGSDGGAQATSTADYGIIGDLVLEARVEGNLVTYSNATARNPQREDRALVMRGLFEFSQGDNELTLGFAIQIHGNKFIGTGRTALVELRQAQLSDQFFVRFERVSFDHNYCSHISSANVDVGATVWLVGRRAIVMGNHIKSLVQSFPSVNFNNMPGPYIGNVTSGATLNHADFPVPAGGFNMIAP
jgi:hypothetical protein